jgi:P-type conjugative transfer protein TrbG
MSSRLVPSLAVLMTAALGACASATPALPDPPLVSAVLQGEIAPAPIAGPSIEPTPPVLSADTPAPAEAPAQPVAPEASSPEPRDPAERIARANAAARIEPTRDGYANAVQVYAFDDGALFQVYAAPGQVTDIALQPGETLSSSGPVAAGDTTRWIIGDTLSGSGAQARIHILVKPTRPALRTNLIINTDRRTYHVELRSTASTYMASVSWQYPQDELIALRAASASTAARAAEPRLDIDALSFDYRISGDETPWRPVRAFDDGRQVFIEFGPNIEAASLPPLFVRSEDGRSVDLVNYRIAGRRLVVDRLFNVAELRLAGPRGRLQIVRIEKAEHVGR